MESTLLTSPAAFSRFAASKSTTTTTNSISIPLLSQLRIKATCPRGLNRFGPVFQTSGCPVRKNTQSVSSTGGNSGVAAEAGEDVIILNVGGMMCGGCADSVKRILESQPQVSSASVELTTEKAIIWPVSEAKVIPNWQKELGEALAKHLTTCGFESSA